MWRYGIGRVGFPLGFPPRAGSAARVHPREPQATPPAQPRTVAGFTASVDEGLLDDDLLADQGDNLLGQADDGQHTRTWTAAGRTASGTTATGRATTTSGATE